MSPWYLIASSQKSTQHTITSCLGKDYSSLTVEVMSVS